MSRIAASGCADEHLRKPMNFALDWAFFCANCRNTRGRYDTVVRIEASPNVKTSGHRVYAHRDTSPIPFRVALTLNSGLTAPTTKTPRQRSPTLGSSFKTSFTISSDAL